MSVVKWCHKYFSARLFGTANVIKKTWPAPTIKLSKHTIQQTSITYRVYTVSIVVLSTNMDASHFATSIAVIGFILLMVLLVLHFFGPRTAAWIHCNREEKMGFRKNKIYNANGYLVSARFIISLFYEFTLIKKTFFSTQILLKWSMSDLYLSLVRTIHIDNWKPSKNNRFKSK